MRTGTLVVLGGAALVGVLVLRSKKPTTTKVAAPTSNRDAITRAAIQVGTNLASKAIDDLTRGLNTPVPSPISGGGDPNALPNSPLLPANDGSAPAYVWSAPDFLSAP